MRPELGRPPIIAGHLFMCDTVYSCNARCYLDPFHVYPGPFPTEIFIANYEHARRSGDRNKGQKNRLWCLFYEASDRQIPDEKVHHGLSSRSCHILTTDSCGATTWAGHTVVQDSSCDQEVSKVIFMAVWMRVHAWEPGFYIIYCTFGYIIQVLDVYYHIQFSYVWWSLFKVVVPRGLWTYQMRT